MEKGAGERSREEVFVPENHGLVIGGTSCQAALELLSEVERRVAVKPRSAPEADVSLLVRRAEGTEWRLPGTAMLHALGTDPASRAILAGGILYLVRRFS